MLLHLEFTFNFSTIFVNSFNIRVSHEALPAEVRSPEIRLKAESLKFTYDEWGETSGIYYLEGRSGSGLVI